MKTVAIELLPLLDLLGSWEASYPARADVLAKQLLKCGVFKIWTHV